MRKLLLFPALMLTCFYSTAGEGEASITAGPTFGGSFPHFNNGWSNGGSGGSVSNQRVIAKVYAVFKDGGFMPVDSSTYKYSSNRGSVPNNDEPNNDDHILFDLSTTYKFNTASWGFENNRQRLQYFSGDKVTELVYKKWHLVSGSFKNSERYIYSYDINGKMQSSLLQLWYGTLWTNSMNSTLSYDNNDNIVHMNSTTYNVDFVYDANNNLVRIEDRQWTQSTGWSNNERKSYAYSGNHVIEYVHEEWMNNTWTLTQKFEYSYNVDNIIETKEYSWNGNAWAIIKRNLYTYDQADNVVEDVVQNWNTTTGAYIPSQKETRTYNSKALPEVIETYTWDGQNWVHNSGDVSIRFYYEQYNPTSVQRFDGSLLVINAYPVPATTHINIDMNWDKPQEFALTLTDMTGKIVYKQKEAPLRHYRNEIPVNNIPAGNYLLTVAANDGAWHKKLVISH